MISVLDSSTRLLIVVPHPDDETLATGGLIQTALEVGASLRVVIVTDGDDNPWPQRWVEKRWYIDANARARWGARRRKEAAAALSVLGVAEHDIRHYGWPDQGLTGLLMRDARSEAQLRAEVEDFAPSLIVAPSLADRHPDHNALRVMLELALSHTPFADCRRLGYVVHGCASRGERVEGPTNAGKILKKYTALQAHVSQLVLSKKRMIRICGRKELFEARPDGRADAADRDWHVPYSRRAFQLHRRSLYLIVETSTQVIRTRLALPDGSSLGDATHWLDESARLGVQLNLSANGLGIRMVGETSFHRVFAKVERLGPRVLIYDSSGWLALNG